MKKYSVIEFPTIDYLYDELLETLEENTTTKVIYDGDVYEAEVYFNGTYIEYGQKEFDLKLNKII